MGKGYSLGILFKMAGKSEQEEIEAAVPITSTVKKHWVPSFSSPSPFYSFQDSSPRGWCHLLLG